MTTEIDATVKDHPWTVCPGPECPFHIWPVWVDDHECEEGRGVLFNRGGGDLPPQARVGKWLREKTVIPFAEETR